jgi:hypothetical protein
MFIPSIEKIIGPTWLRNHSPDAAHLLDDADLVRVVGALVPVGLLSVGGAVRARDFEVFVAEVGDGEIP